MCPTLGQLDGQGNPPCLGQAAVAPIEIASGRRLSDRAERRPHAFGRIVRLSLRLMPVVVDGQRTLP